MSFDKFVFKKTHPHGKSVSICAVCGSLIYPWELSSVGTNLSVGANSSVGEELSLAALYAERAGDGGEDGDEEMRQDMNVEDEYYKAIEDRDTAIMQRDKMLKERDCKMAQMDERLSQQSEQLSQQSEQLRNMAKALFVNGLSVEQISNMTGIDIDIIAKFIG